MTTTYTGQLTATDGSGKTATSTIVLDDGILPPPNSPPDPVPVPDPGDGSANAPAGGFTPFPGLLSGYANRPSFKVPGVDYPVGPPAGIVFKKPGQSPTPDGCKALTGSKEFVISKPNITLEGWDFSIDGGWAVEVGHQAGADDLPLFRKSIFKVGANGRIPIWIKGSPYAGNTGKGCTLEYCTIDGAKRNIGGEAIVTAERSGLHTIRYCWIHDAGTDLLRLGADTIESGFETTMLIEFNAIGNSGGGDFGHPDQLVTAEAEAGKGKLYGLATIHHNLIYNDAGVGTQGFTLDGNTKAPAALFKGGSIHHNVCLMKTTPKGVQSYQFAVALTDTDGTWDYADNFFDPVQLNNPKDCMKIRVGAGNKHGKQTCVRCIDMRNGNSVDNPGQA